METASKNFSKTSAGGQVFVGTSDSVVALHEQIKKMAAFPRPVLVLGERGVGKELVARMLHELSPRSERPFVVVNSGAVAEGLMASEVFGHERGAFTSATNRRRGKLEEADGGALFLDEIANMPLDLQRLLIRVIEYQEFERVGGTEKVRVEARIIAATNADLEERVEDGSFLPDLYDRLRFGVIRVPPLRGCRDDIPDLARHFLRNIKSEMPWLTAEKISDDAIVELMTRPWPGNVRELRAAVETAAVLAEGAAIECGDLPDHRRSRMPGTEEASGFADQVAAYEKKLLLGALESSSTRKDAAKRLELSYDQFRRLAKKHNL